MIIHLFFVLYLTTEKPFILPMQEKTMPDLQRIFESVPGLYLVLSTDLVIINASNAYLKATHTKREEITGKHLFDVFPDNPGDLTADGVSNLKASLNYVLEHAKPHTMAIQKYDIRNPNGTFEERFWSPVNTPVLDEKGRVSCLIHRVEDVTEFMVMRTGEKKILALNLELEQKVKDRTRELEKKIEELKTSEEKFQKTFLASPAGMTIMRLTDTRLVDANDAFLKMVGYTRDEVLGHTGAELGLVADSKIRDEVLKTVRENGTLKHMEMTIRNRKGDFLNVLSSIETIVHNGERFAINIIYDITDRKRTEKKMELINRELEITNQELESFTYSVSHDLRAPLRAINGYAIMLEDDYRSNLDQEGIRFITVIKENAQRMGELIDDLLAFSHLGKKEIRKSLVNMNELVKKVISEVDNTHPAAKFHIDDLHPVMADYSLMTQAVMNLVSNAVKYSSRTKKPEIRISSRVENGTITYTISDNGVGFDMQYAHKLFGVFQRLHDYEEFSGTGVGLAIVNRIVTKHGGEVKAESEPGKGATFYILLPNNEN